MAKSNRQKRIRRSKDEILSILADLHKSGLSRKEFAGSRGLSSSSVDNWFRRAKKRGWKIPEYSRLIPVEVQDTTPTEPAEGEKFEIIARNNLVIRVPVHFDPRSLRRLLALVEESC